MKSTLVVGLLVLSAGCAGWTPRAESNGVSGRWQGYQVRNGLRAPLAIELTESSRTWQGYLSAGDNFVPLEKLQVTPTAVHFELPGQGVFEGSIAGDAIAGAILGSEPGSFSLERRPAGTGSSGNEPYPYGP